ncbi:hypothetical protein HMPREF1219_01889 [Corynebacterium pyruviciproducens ATCC BAA-1742]|uniref:Uncharacterized protein n=1 Tax=Corynebacterium pyruviciproducens ATCC BAA-1742 TaxID=1125779 RepID=S2YWI9_9CORY|nr:hypothetical protein [Corynebacterium pyruviciproducens]EPD68703.1 hypothetical protein HMPREF1219_01889 [Corynebacterium pyruviciproducens ATCC BAA-1742]
MASSKQSPAVCGLIGAIVVLVVAVAVLMFFLLRSPDTTTTATVTETTTSVPEETTAVATTAVAAATPTTEEKCGTLARNATSGMTDPVQKYCDGEWMYAVQGQSDRYSAYRWDNGHWAQYLTHRDAGNSFWCYDRSQLVADGVPADMIKVMALCEYGDPTRDPARGEFAWMGPGVTCDGRWILIVESVLVGPGEAAPLVIGDAIDRWPGAYSTPGSACSSMRPKYEGKEVWAIYYDAGHSVDEVCALKAKYGGNARSMNNVGDFSDPC